MAHLKMVEHPKKHRKRRQSHLFVKLFCIASTFVVILNFLALYKYLDSKVNNRSKRRLVEKAVSEDVYLLPLVFHSRKLLNSTTTPPPPTEPSIGDYPQGVFTLKQKKEGWIVLHCIGVLYMFLGLALVCDEFFVPALHAISSILKISDDVAGATFMAAGGSAPELFTSIIGVFFSDSQVGFGTIVGSAVFNVLFVIGMCAMFSKTLLELTWWPLLRDSIFYIIALILLIVFFSDGAISWHESLGLFLVYIAYVSFMVKNSSIENAVKSYISKKTRASSVTPIEEKNGASFLSLPTVISKNAFRNGAIQLVIHTLDPIAEAGVDAKFQKIKDHYDTVSHGSTQKDATSSLLDDQRLTSPNRSETTILPDDTNENNNLQQQHSVSTDGNEMFEMTQTDQQHTEYRDNATSCNTTNGTIKSKNRVDQLKESDPQSDSRPDSVSSFTNDGENNQNSPHSENKNQDGDINPRGSVRFSSRRLSSRASCRSHRGLAPIKKESSIDDVKEPEDDEGTDLDEDEEPLDLSWPDNNFERIYYIVKAPLLLLLVITLPDVRRPRLRKLFPLTFAVSILWIAIFSYLMLWWVSEIGRVAGVDVEIMGLTIIAAGTSIPDLITSVVVARQGLGDMAVSSSIGSNIFDVTVGLPLPWFAYSMSQNFKDVIVQNSGLFCSTILLFVMLVTVVITIAASKWRMTKMLGGAMFGLYVVFIALTLLLQLGVFDCPFDG